MQINQLQQNKGQCKIQSGTIEDKCGKFTCMWGSWRKTEDKIKRHQEQTLHIIIIS